MRDDRRGGADCGGICQCVQNVACTANATFDSSPAICACVPAPVRCGGHPNCGVLCEYGYVIDANVCPTCQCTPAPADPCAAVQCATGTHCVAVAPPCAAAATSCPLTGACVPNERPTTCGGIAAIARPGAGTCVDDPSDSCDPSAGGADCGGVCQCVQTVLCTTTSRFDSSPDVCACVPLR